MSDEIWRDDPTCGRVRLYHPSGALVTLPVPGAVAFDYANALANVTAALAAGWLVTAPGLEAGEQRVDIGYVVRRSKQNEDRSTTPIVDLYPADEAMKFSILSVYLNTQADVEAFEFASKIRLNKLPEYEGDNKVERGKKAATDAKVIKVPKPFGVVYIANPKWNAADAEAAAKAGNMYPVPKRKFVRWADQKPPAADAQPASEPAPDTARLVHQHDPLDAAQTKAVDLARREAGLSLADFCDLMQRHFGQQAAEVDQVPNALFAEVLRKLASMKKSAQTVEPSHPVTERNDEVLKGLKAREKLLVESGLCGKDALMLHVKTVMARAGYNEDPALWGGADSPGVAHARQVVKQYIAQVRQTADNAANDAVAETNKPCTPEQFKALSAALDKYKVNSSNLMQALGCQAIGFSKLPKRYYERALEKARELAKQAQPA